MNRNPFISYLRVFLLVLCLGAVGSVSFAATWKWNTSINRIRVIQTTGWVCFDAGGIDKWVCFDTALPNAEARMSVLLTARVSGINADVEYSTSTQPLAWLAAGSYYVLSSLYLR